MSSDAGTNRAHGAPTIEATYKAREVEGVLDLYFYRPIGFRLARAFRAAQDDAGGRDLAWRSSWASSRDTFIIIAIYASNVVGMVLHVCANALDNADGQLARLTHRESRDGRIIDSIADHLVFVSIYVHLTLRYLVAGSSPSYLSSRACGWDQSCIARRSG